MHDIFLKEIITDDRVAWSQSDEEATEHMLNLVEQLPPEAISMKKSYADKLRIEGREEGLQEGRQEGIRDTARQMLLDQFPIESICKYTQLTREEVLRLSEELKKSGGS